MSLSHAEPAADTRGTYLGVLCAPVADAMHEQLPQLPRQQGVLVTRVLPDSPAATADLRRHDILLTYDGKKINDCEQLARLIRDDKAGRRISVTYLRAGREATADVTLIRGPALQLAEPKAGTGLARAANKPGAPASVNVSATLLENGKLRVTIEYSPEGSDRTRTVTWEGEPSDVDGAVRALPERERSLARHALARLRTLGTPPAPVERRPPS
jgi:hypothetical protein